MQFPWRKKGLVNEDPTKPGLRRRLLNTLLLILLFRLLANIPVVNVDEEKMHELLAHNPLLGAIDLFAGGEVLTSFSVVAAGLFPYLLAAGVVALAARVVPALRDLEKDSEKERFERYTKSATVLLAFVFAWGITRYLSLQTGLPRGKLHWFARSQFLSTLAIVSIVTLGAKLTEKIKDWITDHGVGPGESTILLISSSLAFITYLSDLAYSGAGTRAIVGQLAVSAGVGLGVVILSVPLARGVRNISMVAIRHQPVARLGMGGGAPTVSLPLLINRGGTSPVSSALGFIAIFQIIALFFAWIFPGKLTRLQSFFLAPTHPEHGLYWAVLAVLVIVFTYITNFTVLWKPHENSDLPLAEELRRRGEVFIPGFRPGEQTARYLSRVMTRITFPAAATLAFLAAGLPYLILKLTGQNVAVAVLSIVVFVKSFLEVRERFQNYRAIDHAYDGFLKKDRLR